MGFIVTIGGEEFPAFDVKITKKLNEAWMADFKLQNTAETREIESLQDVIVKLNESTYFTGVFHAPSYDDKNVIASCSEKGAYLLDEATISLLYDGTINEIMSDIAARSSLAWGSDLTERIKLRFNQASGLYATIVTALHSRGNVVKDPKLRSVDWLFGDSGAPYDWWSDGSKVYMGVKGTYKGEIDLSGAKLTRSDWSKVRSKVTARGWEDSGNGMSVSYGSGTNEEIIDSRNARDLGTLGNLASRRYRSVCDPVVGCDASIDILSWDTNELDIGDVIYIENEQLKIKDQLRIVKAVISEKSAVASLGRAFNPIDDELVSILGGDAQPSPAYSGVSGGGAYSGVGVNKGSTGASVGSIGTGASVGAIGTGVATLGGYMDKTICLDLVTSPYVTIANSPSFTTIQSGNCTTITDAMNLALVESSVEWDPTSTSGDAQVRIETTGLYPGWLYYFSGNLTQYGISLLIPANLGGYNAAVTARTNVTGMKLRANLKIYQFKKHIHAISDPTHANPFSDPTHANPFVDPTHLHSVADPLHVNPLYDTYHVNQMTDKRQALRGVVP